jgi:hypothetical protein
MMRQPGVTRWLWTILAAMLLVACGSSSTGTSSRGVVSGVVNSAPGCPMDRVGSPCPPRPVAGAAVVALIGNKTRAHTTTGTDGRFELKLPFGRYLIRATDTGGMKSSASTEIDVHTATVSIEIDVDSGIR